MARQRTRTETQTEQRFASSENTDGVTFSKGNMMVNDEYQTPVEVKKWRSSNGITVHTAVTWESPETGERRISCNCSGWAIKKRGRPRRCKHTDDLQGIKMCNAEPEEAITIQTEEEATAAEIPGYDTRNFRGIDLSDD